MLERFGYDGVGTASNGIELVEQVMASKPDLVLTDFHMPELDGLEATRRLLKADPGLKVVIMTAQSQEGLISDAMSLGASDFVAKPITEAKMAEVMKKVLNAG